MKNSSLEENIFTIDIGASFIKAIVLDHRGELLQGRMRVLPKNRQKI